MLTDSHTHTNTHGCFFVFFSIFQTFPLFAVDSQAFIYRRNQLSGEIQTLGQSDQIRDVPGFLPDSTHSQTLALFRCCRWSSSRNGGGSAWRSHTHSITRATPRAATSPHFPPGDWLCKIGRAKNAAAAKMPKKVDLHVASSSSSSLSLTVQRGGSSSGGGQILPGSGRKSGISSQIA